MDPITLITVVCIAGLADAAVRHNTGRGLFERVGSAATAVAGTVRGIVARDRPGSVLRSAVEAVPGLSRDGSSRRPRIVRTADPGPSRKTVRDRPGMRPGDRPGTAPSRDLGTVLSDPRTTVGPSGDPLSGRPGRTTTRTVTRTRGWSWDWTVTLVRPRPETPVGRPAAGDGTPPSVPGDRPGETPLPPAGPHPSPTGDPETVPGGGDNGAPSPSGTHTPPPSQPLSAVPDGPSGTTDPTPTEDPVSQTATIAPSPSSITEDVPAHIAAGLDLADAVEDVVEQSAHGITERIRAHIASAEAIPGFPPSLQAAWEDEVASRVEQAWTLLAGAAEGARVAARREQDELSPLVEAASGAPADGGGLTVGTLRAQ